MDLLYNKIQQMKKRPGLYIGKTSLFFLQAYLNGYVAYHNEVNVEQNYFFLPQFQEYIQKRFKIEITHSWADIITFHSSSDDAAFDAFYQLLDDFVSENKLNE